MGMAVYNQPTTPAFPNPEFSPIAAEATFPLVSCNTMKTIWEQSQEFLKDNQWQCENNVCTFKSVPLKCENPPFAEVQSKAMFEQYADDKCSLKMENVRYDEANIDGTVILDGDRLSANLVGKQPILRLTDEGELTFVDSTFQVTGESDLQDYLRFNMAVDGSEQGSFEIGKDLFNPEKIAFSAKAGGAELLTGQCQVKPNSISCETGPGIVSLMMGGPLKAELSKEVTEAGVETLKFDLAQTSSLIGLAARTQSLVSLQSVFDKTKGDLDASAYVKGIMSNEPLFVGNIKCKGQFETCFANAKSVSEHPKLVINENGELDIVRAINSGELSYAHSPKQVEVELNSKEGLSISEMVLKDQFKARCDYDLTNNTLNADCNIDVNQQKFKVDLNAEDNVGLNINVKDLVENTTLTTINTKALPEKYFQVVGEIPVLGLKGNATCGFSEEAQNASCNVYLGEQHFKADASFDKEKGVLKSLEVVDVDSGKVVFNDSGIDPTYWMENHPLFEAEAEVEA